MRNKNQSIPRVINATPRPSIKTNTGSRKELKLVLVIIAAIAVYLLYINTLVIKSVTVQPEDHLLESTLSNKLEGKSLFSKEVISAINNITTTNSKISAVDCRRSIPSQLSCKLSFRKPYFTLKSNSNQYSVDADGIIFEYSGDGVFTVEDTTGANYQNGQSAFSSHLLSLYEKLFNELSSKVGKIESVKIGKSLIQPTFVISRNNAQLEVLTNLENNAQLQADSLLAFLNNELYKGTNSIDLRVQGKIYTK